MGVLSFLLLKRLCLQLLCRFMASTQALGLLTTRGTLEQDTAALEVEVTGQAEVNGLVVAQGVQETLVPRAQRPRRAPVRSRVVGAPILTRSLTSSGSKLQTSSKSLRQLFVHSSIKCGQERCSCITLSWLLSDNMLPHVSNEYSAMSHFIVQKITVWKC